MLAAVHVRTERHAVVFDIVEFGKRKDLKPAAVGENRSVPVHKLMKSAGGFYDFVARTPYIDDRCWQG